MHGFNFAAHEGFGMLAGPVSAFRECWDFDCPDTFEAFVSTAGSIGLGDVVARIRAGYEDRTPRDGVRWIVTYPNSVIWRDCTLAKRPTQPEERHDGTGLTRTLIECPTFNILAPSNGRTHPSGVPYLRVSGGFDTIASYTADERADLLALARTFDQMPRPDAAPPRFRTSIAFDGDRPGDDFNRRAAWDDLLPDWTLVYDRGGTLYLRRPGKDRGVSATINHGGSDRLHVFSTSTVFDAERSYDKFGAYARLRHGDDYGAAARALARNGYGQRVDAAPAAPPPVPSSASSSFVTLAEVDDVFRRWLGDEYDFQALHAVLAAAAAEQLSGDPAWLLLLSGPGNAKTETVQALAGAGAIVTSTISSEGALLSATARRERAKDATGGLLRRIGARGLLVVKDVTSILSMNRDARNTLLAALREVHDGYWERNVGSDGGRSLAWSGRIVLIGAVTTAWDRAHDVIASMGDRFVIVRMDSTTGRITAGRQACANTGQEKQMRGELAGAVGGLLSTVTGDTGSSISDAERDRLLEAANIVTLARTGVEYDYRGDVIDAHAPEMPTRFAKQLMQLVRGAVVLGVDRADALSLAIRCARDSMPPLRLVIVDDVAAHPGAYTHDVRQRLGKPRATVDRQLQALQMLGVLVCQEHDDVYQGKPVTRWSYRLAEGIDPGVLARDHVPDLSPHAHAHTEKDGRDDVSPPGPVAATNISGTVTVPPSDADRQPQPTTGVDHDDDDKFRA
jgi:hypothetical protein